MSEMPPPDPFLELQVARQEKQARVMRRWVTPVMVLARVGVAVAWLWVGWLLLSGGALGWLLLWILFGGGACFVVAGLVVRGWAFVVGYVAGRGQAVRNY